MVGVVQRQSVASMAHRRIVGWGRGRVFVPLDLLDLGSRQAVDVLLHRLAAKGTIRNLARGVYDYPKKHDRFGLLTPSADDIARAVARSSQASIVRSGATAANFLGLSTQVPARTVYLTDGPTRSVRAGKLTIRLRHAAPSRMVGGDTTAGLVLRALQFFGQDAIDDAMIAHLRRSLSDADRNALVGLRQRATTWMQPIIARIVDGEAKANDKSNLDTVALKRSQAGTAPSKG